MKLWSFLYPYLHAWEMRNCTSFATVSCGFLEECVMLHMHSVSLFSFVLIAVRRESSIWNQDHMLTSCGPLNRAAMDSHYGCGELYGGAFGGTHPSRSVLWEFRNAAALLLSLIMQPHFYNSAKRALYPGFLQPMLLPVFWVAACC